MCIYITTSYTLTRPLVAYKVVLNPRWYRCADGKAYRSLVPVHQRWRQRNWKFITPGTLYEYYIGQLAKSDYPGMYCFLTLEGAITYNSLWSKKGIILKVLCPVGSHIIWSHEPIITTSHLIPMMEVR